MCARASTPCQKDPHPASGYELRLGSLIGPVQTCIEVAFQSCNSKTSPNGESMEKTSVR